MLQHAMKRAVLAVALLATSVGAATAAQAREGYGHRGGGDDAAIAIGAGVVGLAIGAALASDHHRGYYRDRYYPRYRNDYYYDGYPAYYRDSYRRYDRGYPRYRGEWYRGRRGGSYYGNDDYYGSSRWGRHRDRWYRGNGW